MADSQEAERVEELSRQMYETTDPATRASAESTLVELANAPNCLELCILILDRRRSPYAQNIAASTLAKITSALSPQQRLDLRAYCLQYVRNSGSDMLPWVLSAVVSLWSKVVKQGWWDVIDDKHVLRDVVNHVSGLMEETPYTPIALKLLTQLVTDMNCIEMDSGRARHRKTASSFRDHHLYDVVRAAVTASRRGINVGSQDITSSAVKLALACLNFDFIGTGSEEISDDLATVQVPTTWRPLFLDSGTVRVFLDSYIFLQSSNECHYALSCLVQLASCRRSLFNNSERAVFLSSIVECVRSILEQGSHTLAQNELNYHEFCRLLARLKSNYQLQELVKLTDYQKLLDDIAGFTLFALRNVWPAAPNSVHYVLALWQRLVASVPYVKAAENHMLDTYAPEVARAFIQMRLQHAANDGDEELLKDSGMLTQQLEQLATIGRCEYTRTAQLLSSLMDEACKAYVSNNTDTVRRQLAWLIYMIGAVIGGRVSFSSTDAHDDLDGELTVKVLQLVSEVDNRLALGQRSEHVDKAILFFFEQFRKMYVGEQVPRTSKMYRRLQESLGLGDETAVLGVIIHKLLTNLKLWPSPEQPVVVKTLLVLSDLSIGYSSVRKLVKLDAVKDLLERHSPETVPLLRPPPPPVDPRHMRCRSTLYTALGRLLLLDLADDDEKFESFMAPVGAALEAVERSMSSNDSPEMTKRTLIGLIRDIKGIAFAFNTKSSFMLLLDWLMPRFTPLLRAVLEKWRDDPNLSTPVLKLYAELAQNRSQRLHFDVSSPNGILLFREISQVVVLYGRKVLENGSTDTGDIYTHKLKGVSICMQMLKAALAGNYVNFGVFALYGDPALEDSLQMIIQMVTSFSRELLLQYTKLAHAYYALMECLAQDHVNFISRLEPQVIVYILSTVADGLSSLDTVVSTSCCAILDNILSYVLKKVFRRRSNNNDESDTRLMATLDSNSQILQHMLSTVLHMVMYEECRNQWSMSRPLLVLVLLQPECWTNLRTQMEQQQPENKRVSMSRCFDNLMEGIERNLLVKNRDRFTQNLSVFRRDVTEVLRGGANRPTTRENEANGAPGEALDMMS